MKDLVKISIDLETMDIAVGLSKSLALNKNIRELVDKLGEEINKVYGATMHLN